MAQQILEHNPRSSRRLLAASTCEYFVDGSSAGPRMMKTDILEGELQITIAG